MLKICFKLLNAVVLFVAMTTGVHAVTATKIAFVDSGNTGRSMTSAALAQRWISGHQANVVVISRAVNLNPYNVTPEPDFVRLLKPLGIDVSAHRAAQFDKGVVNFSDLIFVMTAAHRDRILADFPEAKAKVYLLSEYATNTQVEIQDAYGKDSAFYDEVFKQLNELIPLLMQKLPQKK